MIDLKTYNNLGEVKLLLAECMWPDDERIARELDQYLTNDSRGLFGIMIDNELAGLIGIIPYSEDAVELKHIAMKAPYRGRGIGKKLIAEYMRDYQPSTIIAETDQDAVGFYRKVGFEIHSLGEKYPGVERFQCIQFYQLVDDSRQEYGYTDADGIIYGMDQFIGETDYWNRGIGKQLISSMQDYLIHQCQADKVVMDPQTWNARALACYEQCGFVKKKLLKEHELHEGQFRDCWLIEFSVEVAR
ncbi:GNAT family N-acetyltransferase [Paenibacillus aceti]|uniref:GNAT family N-acetyltransferase n=1 Tax=Paenibacillus aceti TaxID=1820010 RepID=UPI0016690D8B|nr:GNAT family N-acetyltransferase [Paenibacillus aceti]